MNQYPVFDTTRCDVPGLQSIIGWHLLSDCNVPTAPPPIHSCDPVINLAAPPSFLGLQGFQGVAGLPGLNFQGSQGFQGFQGVQGFQGLQGLQGFQGLGFQGFQGVQGFQGIAGVVGFQGLPGIQGPPGPSGTPYYAISPAGGIHRASGPPPDGTPTPFISDIYTMQAGIYLLYELQAQCYSGASTDVKAGKTLVMGRHNDGSYSTVSEFC